MRWRPFKLLFHRSSWHTEETSVRAAGTLYERRTTGISWIRNLKFDKPPCSVLLLQLLVNDGQAIWIQALRTATHTTNRTSRWLTAPWLGSYGPPTLQSHLVPIDSHLFGLLKKHPAGKRFATDADVKRDFTPWLQTLDMFSTLEYKPCCQDGANF